MIRKPINIKMKLGLHARPSSLLAKTAGKFKSAFKINKDGFEVDGKSVINLMMLAAAFGEKIELIAEGSDEEELMNEVVDLFESKFGEE